MRSGWPSGPWTEHQAHACVPYIDAFTATDTPKGICMSVSQITLLVIAAVVLFWAVGAYNRLIRLRNEIGNAFAQIDVQLKRRHDLIPNLVEVARKYLEHERDTLERVIAARAQSMAATELVKAQPNQSGPIKSLGVAEATLAGAMGRFQAVIESYPELKADKTLAELREELTHTENKVAFSRQLFNDASLDYNNAAHQFPANLVAGLFRFRTAEMLQATTSDAERAAPVVQF
jgi:LemA protein